VCPRCGGDMRLVALIREEAVAERILRHPGLWERGPPRGRRLVADSAGRELDAFRERARGSAPAGDRRQGEEGGLGRHARGARAHGAPAGLPRNPREQRTVHRPLRDGRRHNRGLRGAGSWGAWPCRGGRRRGPRDQCDPARGRDPGAAHHRHRDREDHCRARGPGGPPARQPDRTDAGDFFGDPAGQGSDAGRRPQRPRGPGALAARAGGGRPRPGGARP
jgi:hypothetical protein